MPSKRPVKRSRTDDSTHDIDDVDPHTQLGKTTNVNGIASIVPSNVNGPTGNNFIILDSEDNGRDLTDKQYSGALLHIDEIGSKNFNVKTAFNYDFIDVMQRIVDRPQVGFKVLGSSLEAATKLYTSKIDLISNAARKVLSSIGIGDADDLDPALEESFEGVTKKKKKPKRAIATIATNPAVLNGRLETVSQIDPLFHHLSASFDVCNVKSLLLANLHTTSEGLLLVQSEISLNLDDLPRPKSCEATFFFNDVKVSGNHSFRTLSGFKFLSRDETDLNESLIQDTTFVPNLDEPVKEIPSQYAIYNEDFRDGVEQHNSDEDTDAGIDAEPATHSDADDADEEAAPVGTVAGRPYEVVKDDDAANRRAIKLARILAGAKNSFFCRQFLNIFGDEISSFNGIKKKVPNRKPRCGLAENVYSLDNSNFPLRVTKPKMLSREAARKWIAESTELRLDLDNEFDWHILTDPFNILDPFYDFIYGGNFMLLDYDEYDPFESEKEVQNEIAEIEGHAAEFADNHPKGEILGQPPKQPEGVDAEDNNHDVTFADDDINAFDQADESFVVEKVEEKQPIRSRFGELEEEEEEILIDYATVAKKVDIKKVKSKMWEIIDVEADFTAVSCAHVHVYIGTHY